MLTAKKHLFSHYGPHQRNQVWAIPYHLGRPSVNSEFGTELEILNYTLQMYLEMGVSPSIIQKEVRRIEAFPIEDTAQKEASLAIEKLLQDTDLQFSDLTYQDYNTIASQSKNDPNYSLDLAIKHALPEIVTYQRKLHSNARTYRFLFKDVDGFTGTLWNIEAFPQIFAQIINSDTQPQTLYSLWTTSAHDVTIVSEGDVDQTLQQLYQDKDDGSLIDLAGFFRGVDNQRVAKRLLEIQWTQRDVQGVT